MQQKQNRPDHLNLVPEDHQILCSDQERKGKIPTLASVRIDSSGCRSWLLNPASVTVAPSTPTPLVLTIVPCTVT